MEKQERIYIRISSEDKKLIEKKAEETGLSVSQYFRKMALEGSILKVEPEDKKTLTGIANNLNQIARIANTTGVVPYKEVEENLTNLIKEIRHAYRKR